MIILILMGVLVGAVLGLRFKAFVLVPVICIALAIVAVGGGARGDDLWQLAGSMIAITVSLQLGYLGGSVARLVVECSARGFATTEMEDEPLRSGRTAGWWSGSVGRLDDSALAARTRNAGACQLPSSMTFAFQPSLAATAGLGAIERQGEHRRLHSVQTGKMANLDPA
jgi:hypothetical protein